MRGETSSENSKQVQLTLLLPMFESNIMNVCLVQTTHLFDSNTISVVAINILDYGGGGDSSTISVVVIILDDVGDGRTTVFL